MSEDDGSGSPTDIAYGKCGIGQCGRDKGVEFGEIEGTEDKAGYCSVKKEVIPFKNGTDEGRHYGPF